MKKRQKITSLLLALALLLGRTEEVWREGAIKFA